MYSCKILADSLSPHGERLTTFEISYPYIIHAEIMTHRMFSRNTQSSRATPVARNIERVQEDPFVPLTFRKNQRGMADGLAIAGQELELSETAWRKAIEDAVYNAKELVDLDVHKALANRVLGPYQWFTMILTATDFDNYFALRCHPEAQAEIRTIAEMMQEQYETHEPQYHAEGAWHLPLVTEAEIHEGYPTYDSRASDNWIRHWQYWQKVSVGRCARVSYLTHDGKRDPAADIALYERLLANGHMSPFEHVARPFTKAEWYLIDTMDGRLHGDVSQIFIEQLFRGMQYAGNLHGWWSARMDVPNQHNYGLTLAA